VEFDVIVCYIDNSLLHTGYIALRDLFDRRVSWYNVRMDEKGVLRL